MTHKDKHEQPKASPMGALTEFRIYSVKEVAVVYYPRVGVETACRSFRKLIRGDKWLYDGLCERGFKPYARTLSPAQICFLVEHLGSPSEFIDITS